MSKIRLLVVDDSVTIRAILAEVFARDEEIDVVGEAAGAREAMAAIPELLPHVVTIDIAMPGIDGIALLGHVIARTGANPVMLSSRADKLAEAWNHGAYGFFDKARILQDTAALRDLIKRAAAGHYADCDDPACDPAIAASHRRRTIVDNVEVRFR